MTHYLPILIGLFALKLTLVCLVGGPRKFIAFVADLLTVGDDLWTWTTRSGEAFEEAEVERIEADELVLRHRFGVARVAIDLLSEKSLDLLQQSPKWNEHLSSAGKITAFPAQISAQAA